MEQNQIVDNDEVVIDLREIFGILKKRCLTIAGFTALCTGAAVAYCLTATPIYESTMALQVRQPRNLKSDMMDFTSQTPNKDYVQMQVGSCKAVVTSQTVMTPIVREFAEPDKNGQYPSVEEFTKAYIKVTTERNSDVVRVAVKAKSPEKAQAMGWKLLDAFNNQMGKMVSDMQKVSEQMLAKRVGDSTKELQDIRAKRDSMYSANGNISPVTVADRTLSRVANMRQKLEDNALAMSVCRMRLQEVDAELSKLPEAEVRNGLIDELYKRAGKLAAEKAALESRGNKGFHFRKVTHELAAVQQQIKEQQDRIYEGTVPYAGGRYAGLRNKKYDLEQELIRRTHDEEYWTKTIKEDEAKIPAMLQQKREYELICEKEKNIKSLNQMILSKYNQLQVSENTETGHVAIIEEPTLNERPVAPRKVRITAVALALGAILSSIYVILKEKM